MKKILFAVMAFGALVACTNEEVIEMDREQIGFGEAFVDNGTRAFDATDPSYTKNDIETLTVYGTANNVVIFPGVTVKKDGKEYGNAWTQTTGDAQYWIPGTEYKFVGIVDGNKSGVTSTTVVDGMPTSISYTADGVTDLLVNTYTKTANTNGAENGVVKFSYTHLVSKVNFKVTNNSTSATGYSFEVSDITFNGYTAATCDVASPALAGTTTGKLPLPIDDITVDGDTAENDLVSEILLIPGDVTVSATVNIKYNDNIIGTKEVYATKKLEAAKAYNFNLGVSVGEKIEFTVTGQPSWDTTAPGITIS